MQNQQQSQIQPANNQPAKLFGVPHADWKQLDMETFNKIQRLLNDKEDPWTEEDVEDSIKYASKIEAVREQYNTISTQIAKQTRFIQIAEQVISGELHVSELQDERVRSALTTNYPQYQLALLASYAAWTQGEQIKNQKTIIGHGQQAAMRDFQLADDLSTLTDNDARHRAFVKATTKIQIRAGEIYSAASRTLGFIGKKKVSKSEAKLQAENEADAILNNPHWKIYKGGYYVDFEEFFNWEVGNEERKQAEIKYRWDHRQPNSEIRYTQVVGEVETEAKEMLETDGIVIFPDHTPPRNAVTVVQ